MLISEGKIAFRANRWRQGCRHRAPTEGFTASWRGWLSHLNLFTDQHGISLEKRPRHRAASSE